MTDLLYRRQSFSERHGHKEVIPPLSPGFLSNQLRLEFVDVLHNAYIEGVNDQQRFRKGAVDWSKLLGNLCVRVFGRTRRYSDQELCLASCENVLRSAEFYEVFDLIETIANEIGDGLSEFSKQINEALMRNKAPYLLHKNSSHDWMIIQTGAEAEKTAVLQSLADLNEPAFIKTREHFEKAGHWLAKGDSAESAGQAAKALEACLRKLTGKPDVTGGQALEVYAKETGLSPRFKQFMVAIWQYRNEAEDVGHSKKDNASSPPPDQSEAQALYVFVAGCLSFLINRWRDCQGSDE